MRLSAGSYFSWFCVGINKENDDVMQRDATVDAWYSKCFTNYAHWHCMMVNDALHSPAAVSTVSIR